MIRLVTRHAWISLPWKNGGGVAHDVVVWPEGAGYADFQWRLSAADVTRDGPFSLFEGIDRCMAILTGAGLILEGVPGAPMRLSPDTPPFAFPGDVSVSARLIAGPVLNMNLMTRRSAFAPGMSRLALSGALALDPQPVVLVHLVAGSGTIEADKETVALQPGDTALCDAPSRLTVDRADVLVMTVSARG